MAVGVRRSRKDAPCGSRSRCPLGLLSRPNLERIYKIDPLPYLGRWPALAEVVVSLVVAKALADTIGAGAI